MRRRERTAWVGAHESREEVPRIQGSYVQQARTLKGCKTEILTTPRCLPYLVSGSRSPRDAKELANWKIGDNIENKVTNVSARF